MTLLYLPGPEVYRAMIDHLSSAAVLGLAVTAMLLGHWYLICTSRSWTPVLRLLQFLLAALVLRAVVTAGLVGLRMPLDAWLATDTVPLLWLGVRVAVGFVGA